MEVVVDNPQLAREMLRVINLGKLAELITACAWCSRAGFQWLTNDGEKEMVLTTEPEAGFWQRFYNTLVAPIVPEMLL